MPIATSTCITKSCVSAFSFEGADVRVLSRSDEPWWVLVDVCAVLGINNVGNAKARLDVDELDDIRITDTIGRLQETTIINESGLYSLILTSRKPAAKRFKKWVTAEVLPAIRKTGSYNVAPRPRRPSVLHTFNTAEVSFTSVGKGFFEKQSDCLSFIFDSLLKPEIFHSSP